MNVGVIVGVCPRVDVVDWFLLVVIVDVVVGVDGHVLVVVDDDVQSDVVVDVGVDNHVMSVLMLLFMFVMTLMLVLGLLLMMILI